MICPMRILKRVFGGTGWLEFQPMLLTCAGWALYGGSKVLGDGSLSWSVGGIHPLARRYCLRGVSKKMGGGLGVRFDLEWMLGLKVL